MADQISSVGLLLGFKGRRLSGWLCMSKRNSAAAKWFDFLFNYFIRRQYLSERTHTHTHTRALLEVPLFFSSWWTILDFRRYYEKYIPCFSQWSTETSKTEDWVEGSPRINKNMIPTIYKKIIGNFWTSFFSPSSGFLLVKVPRQTIYFQHQRALIKETRRKVVACSLHWAF